MSQRRIFQRKRFAKVLEQFRALDHAVFDAIAETESPVLDRLMPSLTSAADHSKLWIALALAMRLAHSRRLTAASTRGLLTLGVASLVTNQVAKRARRRERPNLAGVPLARLSRRMPHSSSFPSGHSASAAAFSAGVALEYPPAGALLGALAGAVAFSRIATGAHYPIDVLAGLGLGAGIAAIGGVLVPPIGPPPSTHTEPLRVPQPPRPAGEGMVVVINPRSGSGRGARILEEVRRRLPSAEVVVLNADDDVAAIIESAAARAEVLGVGGGDGTVGTAAVAAMKHDIPLAVFPAGTFNHFAGDMRIESVEDVAQALRAGSCTKVDVGYLNDKAFLNTASAGAYPRFVQIREKYEGRLGKPLAAAISVLRVARGEQLVTVQYDGKSVDMLMLFIGNSRYEPRGFAPSLRLRMDDGLLDVRLLEASSYLDLARLLVAVTTGRLKRERKYHELDVPEFELKLSRPVAVARDGEVGEVADHLSVRVAYRALTIYRPPRAIE